MMKICLYVSQLKSLSNTDFISTICIQQILYFKKRTNHSIQTFCSNHIFIHYDSFFFVEVPKLAVQFGLNSFVKIKYRSVTYLMQLHFSTLYIIFLKVLDDFFLFAALHYRTELQCAKPLENSARQI